IFSLGAVLYEMATGKRAFEGKTTASVIAAILEREPPAISSVQPMSPPALDVKLQLEWIREAGSQAGVPAPVVAHRKNRERIAWASAIAAIIVAALFAIGYSLGVPQPVPAVVSEISPPPNVNFLAIGVSTGPPALSPDGKLLVFSGLSPGDRSHLWLRSMDSGVTQSIEGTDDASYPFWSPDSRQVG